MVIRKFWSIKKNGGLNNVELLLPVIEIRLKEFVGSNELGRLNYHIIFADDSQLKVDIIEGHFLTGLKAKGNLDEACPTGYTWGGIITRDSLIDLGNHIIDSTPPEKRTAISPLDVGFNNLNFELSKIQDLLGEGADPNTYLKNKYFKAIGKAEWEDFRWDPSSLEKKSVINGAHFVFSASPTAEKAVNGRTSLKRQGVNSRLLHCSDAHKFASNISKTEPKDLGHCFTWIKGDPTFEGLKQIIFEPDERVKIQSDEPDSHKLDHQLIDQVKFISSIQLTWRNQDQKIVISITTPEELRELIIIANKSGLLTESELLSNTSFLDSDIDDNSLREENLKDIVLIHDERKGNSPIEPPVAKLYIL